MTRSALLRASATFAVLCATGLGYAPQVQAATPAASTSETVIPPSTTDSPRGDWILGVGPGGFLHRPEGRNGLVWSTYSGGDTPVIGISGDTSPEAGSDTVAVSSSSQGDSKTIALKDMDTGTATTLTLPSGDKYLGTFGNHVLSYSAGNGTWLQVGALHILSASGGTQTGTTAVGWPSGAVVAPFPYGGDATSVLLPYTDRRGHGVALVDLTIGHVTPAFTGLASQPSQAVLTGQYVGWYDYGSPSTLHLVPRSDPAAAETTVQLPAPAIRDATGVQLLELALVGDAVLTQYRVTYPASEPAGSLEVNPVYQMPLSGGTPSLVVPRAVPDSLFQAADAALVIGGSSPSDWAARRFTAAADGTLLSTSVYSEAQSTYTVDGLAMAKGQLYVIDGLDTGDEQLADRTVQWGGTAPTYSATTPLGNAAVSTDCSTAATCSPPLATGQGGIAQLGRGNTSLGDFVTNQGTSGGGVFVGATGGSLVDSDGYWIVYNGSNGSQYLVENTRYPSASTAWTRPKSAAALASSSVWDDYLWVADPTPGSISLVDAYDRQTQQTVRTDAPCVPTELQAAAQRWIYWSCGASGPAGVWDLATRQDIPVPPGIAQLGDGYLVRHDTAAGKLVLTDFHAGTPVTTDLADLPPGPVADDRRVTWAVDKYGGGIAYVDAQNNIHLLDPHIPASPTQPALGETLQAGEQLTAGHGISNGFVSLIMQSDGNLVAYLETGAAAHGPVLWSSNTSGHPGAYALMQPDGNLVVYAAGGGPATGGALWASNTSGHPGAYADFQEDGNLVVHLPNGSAAWSTGTYARPGTTPAGTVLKPGWWTSAGVNRLVMQQDGNLVVYRTGSGTAAWASNTSGHPGAYAVMQSDGNFVIYARPGGPVLWSSHTYGHPGAYALAQDDGNFVVYRSGGGPTKGGALWASNTEG